MKTAISLPDELFEAGERAAARLGVSRSELYAKALERFIHEQEGEHVTAKINRVLGATPAPLDGVLARMQAASLGADEGSFDDWVDTQNAPSSRQRRKRKHG